MKIAIASPFNTNSMLTPKGRDEVEVSRDGMAHILERIGGAMMEGYMLSFSSAKQSRIEAAGRIGAACRVLSAFAEGFEKAAAQAAQNAEAFSEEDIAAIQAAVSSEFDRLTFTSDEPAKASKGAS